ncbi:MAG: hypothetical protein KDI23_04390, partial [Pseudomonadales bacterium]|nr:hypothetical protein [Pseudomonadales bacterium]
MTERINLPRPPVPPAPPVAAPAERNGFNLKAIPGAVGAIAADVLGGVRDAPGAIALGAAQAVNEAVDIAEGVGQWVEDNLGTGGVEVSMQGIRMLSAEELQAKRKAGDDLSSVLNVPTAEWMQPDTVTGGLVEGVAQFLTGFGAASKVLKGTKIAAGLGQWGTSMAAGAMADAAVFDEHAQRLSNLIQSSPELANPVTEYLAADPTDSMAEGRFKNAIEGLGLGVMAHGLGMAVGAVRRFAQARGVDAADEVARRTANAKAQASEAGYKPPPPDQGPDLSPLGDPKAPRVKVAEVSDEQAAGWLSVAGETEGKAININLARLDTPDDIKEAISKTAKI